MGQWPSLLNSSSAAGPQPWLLTSLTKQLLGFPAPTPCNPVFPSAPAHEEAGSRMACEWMQPERPNRSSSARAGGRLCRGTGCWARVPVASSRFLSRVAGKQGGTQRAPRSWGGRNRAIVLLR